MLRDIFERIKNRDAKWKGLKEDDRLMNRLEERKLPHEERVFIDILKQQKKEAIHDAIIESDKVEKLKEKQKQRNLMKFNPEWFSDDNCILKQENIFANNNRIW